MNKLQSKISNTKTNFSKNLILNAVVPAVIIVVALVIGIVFGFNKGLDYNGGVMVSIVADTQNLENSKEYSQFKSDVDSVLNENGVGGSVYLLEKDSTTYKDILVVKIAYNGNEEKTQELIEGIKTGLIAEFYSETSQNEIELRKLVQVTTFGSQVNSWTIISTILASLITVLLICVYVGFRNGLFTSVLTVLSSTISTALAFAVIMLSRIQINSVTIAVIPFVAILSALATFMFAKKAKQLSKNDNYSKKQNYILANDAVKSNLFSTLLVSYILGIIALAFALVNICNPVIWFGLSLLAGIIAVVYTNLFVIPAIFALSFVRRVKKERVKQKNNQSSLNEEEILKETDLDNLVSN